MRILLAILLLAGCGAQVAPVEREEKPIKQLPYVGTVTSKTYRISDSEHMVIVDIPDRYVPRRCAVYVNETTKTSSALNCNFDDAGASFPLAQQE